MDTPDSKTGAVHLDEQDNVSIDVPVDSPMRWSWTRKHLILLQCCFSGAGPGFTSAILIPGVETIAGQFGTSGQTATYLVAVPVLLLGWAPFVWNPIMHAFGRRFTLISSMLLCCVAALGAGYAHSYGGLMVARIFQAIGVSAGFVVPGVVVVDLFPPEQRGRKSGFWTQMVSMGAPLGGLIGGPVVQYLGWRWVMWLSAIVAGAQTVGFFFTLPETSLTYRRQAGMGEYRFGELLRLPTYQRSQVGFLSSLAEPILMAQSPPVFLVALAYAVCFAITSVGLANILPLVLVDLYGFSAVAQGAFFAGPLVGVILGERIAGPASDWVMNRERKAAATSGVGRPVILERRLLVAILGFIMAPLGVIIFGVTLMTRKHWIAPCIGFGVSNFGLQIVTTASKTYCVDCYTQQSASVLQLINVLRQTLSFTVPFWSPNLLAEVGYGLGFGIEAILVVVVYVVSLVVLVKGPSWRASIHVRGLKEAQS